MLADETRTIDVFHTRYAIDLCFPDLAAVISRAPSIVLRGFSSASLRHLHDIEDRQHRRWLLLELGDDEVYVKDAAFDKDLARVLRRRQRSRLAQLAEARDGRYWKDTGFRIAQFCQTEQPGVDELLRPIEKSIRDGQKLYASYAAPYDGDPLLEKLASHWSWDYCRDVLYEQGPGVRKMRLSYVPYKTIPL